MQDALPSPHAAHDPYDGAAEFADCLPDRAQKV